MLRALIEFYGGLSPWLRFGLAGLFLLAGGVLLLVGAVRPALWCLAVGAVLLVFAFPSKAERHGYHDF
jgi:hypothetical protein